MLRRLFTVASVLSLVMCASAVWLLARNGRVAGERHEIFSAYLKSRHARYTLYGDPDSLAFCAPPPAKPRWPWNQPIPPDEADQRSPATLLELMRNADVTWELWQDYGDERLKLPPNPSDKAPGHSRLHSTDEGLLIPMLLEALEDPQRVAIAHVYLTKLPASGETLPDVEDMTLPQKPAGQFTFAYYGMKVNCSSLGEPMFAISPGGPVNIYNPTCQVDPSQSPALCAQWHARLDRRLVAIPYRRAAIATALLPMIWLATRLRRGALMRHRRRGNRCPSCGYDLRAAKDRCPECGTLIHRNPVPAEKTRISN